MTESEAPQNTPKPSDAQHDISIVYDKKTESVIEVTFNEPNSSPNALHEKDIKILINETNCDRGKAVSMLEKHEGSVVCALLQMFKESDSKALREIDIEIVISQTNCTRDKAISKLEESHGDIVSAIMMISEENGETQNIDWNLVTNNQ